MSWIDEPYDERAERRQRLINLALDIGIPFVAAVATLTAMLILAR